MALAEAYEARELADREAWRTHDMGDHPLIRKTRGPPHLESRKVMYAVSMGGLATCKWSMANWNVSPTVGNTS